MYGGVKFRSLGIRFTQLDVEGYNGRMRWEL